MPLIRWDRDSGELLKPSGEAVTSIELTRGRKHRFVITPVRDGVPTMFGTDAAVRVALKQVGVYDGTPLAVSANLTADTTNKTYSGDLSCSTAALETLFAVNESTSDDVATVACHLDVAALEDGESVAYGSVLIPVTVHNAVTRFDGTEPDVVNGHDLASHSDVGSTAPTDGQVLAWDDAESEWAPADAATPGAHTHTLSDITDAGTAAAEDVGTSAGNVVQLDGSARLPAVDGSQLTNLPGGGGSTGWGDLTGSPSDSSDVSSFGESLLDDADAAAARTTLGLGTLATQNNISSSQLVNDFGSGGKIVSAPPGLSGILYLSVGSSLTSSGSTLDVASSGVTNAMLAGSIDLTTKVTGTLPVANGGTGVTALSSLDAADLGSGAATDGYVLTADGAGGAAWESVSGGGGGGPGGSTDWGDIGGTLSDQTDLQTELDAKLNAASVSTFGASLVDDADAAAARTTLGLGTISTQAASLVNIDGGAIDGAVIGGSTAAAGTFTDLTVTTGAGQFPAGGYTTPSVRVGQSDIGFSAVGTTRIDAIVDGSQQMTLFSDANGACFYGPRFRLQGVLDFNVFGAANATVREGSGTPEATVTANPGSVYLDYTNGHLYVKASGVGNTGWEQVILAAATQTLTNKTISGASNTITNVSLSTGVTGTLPVANGGTGQTSLASVDAADFGAGASADGQVLMSDGSAGAAWEALPCEIGVACSDETTALTTGTAKVTFRMPYAMTLTEVRASVTTAPVGSTLVVDINESGTTVLSTKLSIDASEKTSETAATAAVISDSALADDAEITIDIDQIGSSTAGAGLKVWLIGTRA
jgi:hypothetical protein